MQTRTQQYALKAIDKIDAIKNALNESEEEVRKDYGDLALNFPVMVLQSGLAQTSGFVLAKKRAGQLRYLNDLADVLGETDAENFHKKIIATQLGEYQRLTRHTLDAAGWLKRYVQGCPKIEADATSGGDA
ncbi:hypothetical protein AGMMS50256_30440 [Betaproteobacteria bacterium]|nr:hypothetical protein AGMMS50256_30440 [Betaproteobacteria bacterium]